MKGSMNMRRPHLDAIRERAAAATPGTWKVGSRFGCGSLGSSVAVLAGNLPPVELDPRRNGRADAAFIAHARQDIPALLAEIDRLKAELDSRPLPRVNKVMVAVVEQARHLNGPMVRRLRACAADTSSNWDGATTVYPPETRGLVALIDALVIGVVEPVEAAHTSGDVQ